MLTYDDKQIYLYKNLDLVPKLKSREMKEWFESLPGSKGIGNVRYATSGKLDDKSLLQSTQPITISKGNMKLALSFNGNIVNTHKLRKETKQYFSDLPFCCDSDLICRKLLLELKKHRDLASAVNECMLDIEGAFSVIGISGDGEFFAFKDQHGIKPLCAGHSREEETFAFSSETVGLDINDFVRDFELKPGELVRVSENGFERKQIVESPYKAFCAFEYAYFARPDSRFDDKYVYEIREEFGRNMVRENPSIIKESDVILSVPETGDDPAMGVHEESGIRWERASRRHRYVTERAFILRSKDRYSTIDRKINILSSKIDRKRLIITEDSIVRGDTTKVIIEKLRKSGAKKIFMFVTFPRIIGPCFYGIDMASFEQLIGSKHSSDEISNIIGADAICYQSVDGLMRAIGKTREQLCLACVTGNYPTPLAQRMANETRKRFLNGYQETGRIYETCETTVQAQ